MTTSRTEPITAVVPLSLAERLEALAIRLGRPRDELVCEALEGLLKREDELDRMTREGMQDVDTGRTVPHEDVLAWVDSMQYDLSLPSPTIK